MPSTSLRSADTSSDSSAVRAGASPSQNGIVGGVPSASTTRTTPGSTLADLPRVRAQQEDVAGHRLDGPVLVDGADERVVGLGHHPVVAGLGDGPAGGERGQAGRRPGPELAVDRVVVDVGAPLAPAGRDALATRATTSSNVARVRSR